MFARGPTMFCIAISSARRNTRQDAWLRRLPHFERTASPRARCCHGAAASMLRVQPIHLQGTVENIWEPVLAKLRPEFVSVPDVLPVPAATHAISI